MRNLFQIILTVLTLAAAINTTAAELETPKAETQTAVPAVSPAAGPTLFFGYSYYHYQLNGQSTANTEIYKFGASTVDLNLLSATWLASSEWTVVALLPQISNKVETIYEPTTTGLNFKTTDTTNGLGDLRIMALTPISVNPAHLTMLDIGATLPTGSIDKYFTSSPTQRAAYNMQMGSGTPDLILGATVTNTQGALVSSLRGQITVRGGKNSNNYALGNEFLSKATSIYSFNNYVSAGAVANYKIRGAVVGKDEKYELFNSYQSPVTNISGDGHQYYHGTQANWDATLMAKLQSAAVKNMNATFEVGVPVAQGSQNKDDIKLEMDYYASASLNASF